MKNWKTIHKEITINQETLNAFNEYVDFIHLNDEKISIRLIVKKDDNIRLTNGENVNLANN